MSTSDQIFVQQSPPLHGSANLLGSKNATLPILASLLLTSGKSVLKNVPNSADIRQMIILLQDLGAQIEFDINQKKLLIDTTTVDHYEVKPEIMNKMRASILVMGPLLRRFKKVKVAFPGGCLIGARHINYHLDGFKKMGATVEENHPYLNSYLKKDHSKDLRICLEYPSIGATENLLMFATLRNGETTILNAALEPEVLDVIEILKKMGADISFKHGSTLQIKGVTNLKPVTHSVIPDRLEGGALLLATCITKGSIHLPNAQADHLDCFLEKLRRMGHEVTIGTNPSANNPFQGIYLKATQTPQAINIKTGCYPGFPTDLQAQIMAALCLAQGKSTIEETVFENRLVHIHELQQMGAQIVVEGRTATIHGIETLYGRNLIASDIRASCALVIAGLAAIGTTRITGVEHWKRGYDNFEQKLRSLGANIKLQQHDHIKPAIREKFKKFPASKQRLIKN